MSYCRLRFDFFSPISTFYISEVLKAIQGQQEPMGPQAPLPSLAIAPGTALSAVWLLLGPKSSSPIQMGSKRSRQGLGWDHGREVGCGFGPHPACSWSSSHVYTWL